MSACTQLSMSNKICQGSDASTSRLFLQQTASNQTIVKWRGDSSIICVGEDQHQLQKRIQATKTPGNHWQAFVGNLNSNTKYYYSIGGAGSAKQQHFFTTAPESSTAADHDPIRIWIVGDSGTAGYNDKRKLKYEGQAYAVKEGFLKFNGAITDAPIDLFLMLGDNAYDVGSDEEFQHGVFDVYPEILATAPVWPTIGNHEMGMGLLTLTAETAAHVKHPCDPGLIQCDLLIGGVSVSPDESTYDHDGNGSDGTGMPYLDIFSLPTAGEIGGQPSGTENYYAFDFGNLHVVSLDSQLSARDPSLRAAMKQWLIADLGNNQLDWTIVIFHHPPYSRGAGHNSDEIAPFQTGLDQPQIDMRKEFTSIFEDYGVDLVYSGHAHSYERSHYLRGHRGDANTFNERQHASLNTSGKASLGQSPEPYTQITDTGKDDRVVYTVAGSSGKVKDTTKRKTKTTENTILNHPAHRAFEEHLASGVHSNGLAILGSVVVDVSKRHLEAQFIDINGTVLDSFIIKR